MENKKEEFIKSLKRGVAGVVAGASVLTGATGCVDKNKPEEKTSITTPAETNRKPAQPAQGVGRLSAEERLADKLQDLDYEGMLNILKEMYVNIDKAKNPESKLNPDELEIYYKENQKTCFYVEGRDAIILNGQDSWATEQALLQTGEYYRNIGTNGAPMVIIALKNNDGNIENTIDGIGTIRIGDTFIDEAPITTPELLSTISADGKTTAQEIPQEVWDTVCKTAIKYLKEPDQYSTQVKLPEACEKIATLIYEYGLQEYMPEEVREPQKIQYEVLENTDEGR